MEHYKIKVRGVGFTNGIAPRYEITIYLDGKFIASSNFGRPFPNVDLDKLVRFVLSDFGMEPVGRLYPNHAEGHMEGVAIRLNSKRPITA